MSKEMEELRRKFQERFGDGGDQVFQGVVTEVNSSSFTSVTTPRSGSVMAVTRCSRVSLPK